MKRSNTDLGRRRVCVGAAAACVSIVGFGLVDANAAAVAADHGRVDPPVPIPDLPVRRAGDGAPTGLARLLRGRATALHLMFTGCSSVCPIQGAIFERVQALLPDQQARAIQLISLSIDPLLDTPQALRDWLARYDAREGWIAVAPDLKDLGRMLDVFGPGRDAIETHATQVSIINRQAELVFRTPELPSAEAIANLLCKV